VARCRMALYGVVYAVLENDIRRLLGYHIISQVGYMVAAVGIGTEMAINGATAHAFAHILYKGLLLMGAGAVIHATGRAKMTELGGIANRMRGVLTLYMVGAVSISSVPLFSGFVSKELAVYAASVDGRTLVVVLLKVASVGTFLHTGLKLPFGTWFGREVPALGRTPATASRSDRCPRRCTWPWGSAPPQPRDRRVPRPAVRPAALRGRLRPLHAREGRREEPDPAVHRLGFWLLLEKLHAEPTISLDTDVVYRLRGPLFLRGRGVRRPRHVPRPPCGAAPAWVTPSCAAGPCRAATARGAGHATAGVPDLGARRCCSPRPWRCSC
jgi:multicomponent Na+:H+ antiporter subunit D